MPKYRMAFDTIVEAQNFIEASPLKNENYEIHVVFENDRLERVRTRSAGPVKKRKTAQKVLFGKEEVEVMP